MQAGVEQAAASHRVADSGDQDGRGEFTVVLQPGEFLLLQKLLPPFPGFETLFGQFLPGPFPAAVPVERDRRSNSHWARSSRSCVGSGA